MEREDGATGGVRVPGETVVRDRYTGGQKTCTTDEDGVTHNEEAPAGGRSRDAQTLRHSWWRSHSSTSEG